MVKGDGYTERLRTFHGLDGSCCCICRCQSQDGIPTWPVATAHRDVDRSHFKAGSGKEIRELRLGGAPRYVANIKLGRRRGCLIKVKISHLYKIVKWVGGVGGGVVGVTEAVVVLLTFLQRAGERDCLLK